MDVLRAPMTLLRTLAVAGALGVPALAGAQIHPEVAHDSVSISTQHKQPTRVEVDADGTELYRYGDADRLGRLVDQGHLGSGPNDLKALDREHGVAVISGKDFPSDQLTVPLAPITGMEDSRLLEPGAENYFADAWRLAGQKEGTALAVNSQGGRSQDRLHIHADKIDPVLDKELKEQLKSGKIGSDHFSNLKAIHGGHQYRAIFVPGDKLDKNPMQIVRDQLAAEHGDEYARTHMGQHSIAVVPETDANGRKGFLVIDGRYGSDSNGLHDSGSAEEWLIGHANAPP